MRVHDQCLTSEVLGSLRCDCKQQLELALDYISEHGGCIIYMQQVGGKASGETEADGSESGTAVATPDRCIVCCDY